MAAGYKITDKNLKNVWFVLAKDGFVCDENRRIIEKICEKNGIDQEGTTYIEAEKADWQDIGDILSTPSFFGERLVIVSGTLTNLKDDDIKNITDIVKNTDYNHLALIFSYDDDKKIKAKKYESLFEAAKSNGIFCFVPEIDRRYMEETVIARCKANNTAISKEIARKIADNIGKDMGLLINETDKYCAASNYTEVTRKIVDRVGVKTVEASVFDMIDLICRKRPEKAVEKLNNLFYLRTDEIAILGALATSFADMHRCKLAQAKGISYTGVGKDFEKNAKPYRYQKAMSNSRHFSEKALEEILKMLMETDIALKNSAADKKQLMYVLTVQIIAKGNR